MNIRGRAQGSDGGVPGVCLPPRCISGPKEDCIMSREKPDSWAGDEKSGKTTLPACKWMSVIAQILAGQEHSNSSYNLSTLYLES